MDDGDVDDTNVIDGLGGDGATAISDQDAADTEASSSSDDDNVQAPATVRKRWRKQRQPASYKVFVHVY